MTTLKLSATYLSSTYPATYDNTSAPQSVNMAAILPTVADAQAFAALFPKAARVRASKLYTLENNVVGYVTFDAVLLANGVNGGVNETGLRRFRSLLKTAAKLDSVTVEWATPWGNSYPTREAFDAAIAAAV